MVSRSARSRTGRDGVLKLTPGRTETRWRRIFGEEGRVLVPERLLLPAGIARIVVEALALPRTGEVTEVRIRSLEEA